MLQNATPKKKESKMKLTISEKVETAIDELNRAAMFMHRQMKSGELDKAAADKVIFAAQKKSKSVRNSYCRNAGEAHCRQVMEYIGSELHTEFNMVNNRFGKVLKHYAKAVGAEFLEN
jgi:hypothetical protein